MGFQSRLGRHFLGKNGKWNWRRTDVASWRWKQTSPHQHSWFMHLEYFDGLMIHAFCLENDRSWDDALTLWWSWHTHTHTHTHTHCQCWMLVCASYFNSVSIFTFIFPNKCTRTLQTMHSAEQMNWEHVQSGGKTKSSLRDSITFRCGGAMTSKKKKSFNLNLSTWKRHHILLWGCNEMFENKDISHFIARQDWEHKQSSIVAGNCSLNTPSWGVNVPVLVGM